MQNTHAAMLVQLVASVLHVALCYIFVLNLEMGVRGLGLATSLTNMIKIVLLLLYCLLSPGLRKALVRPTMRDVFSNWGEYLKMAIPATIILCSEYWAEQMITVLAGLLGTTEQAA